MIDFLRLTHACIPRDNLKEMVMAIAESIDHDAAKQLDPGTAEEPEFAEDRMEELTDIIEEYGD